ncbi:MAG: MFS transporter [Clostridiales bacterium]|nr:MFS transporter [Clostridiales bacterium]
MHHKELTNAKKWTILIITSISTFMATLDGSIVNITLPIMSSQLKVTVSSIQWVVTSYLLTISILLLAFGKLSDIYGKKKLFASGFLIFAIGSAFCSLSHTLIALVISRVIQAIGAAAMMSLSQGIVTGIFPPTERGRALGFVGTMVALGSLVGPSLGGVLVHLFGWPSIFIINIPIGLIGSILAYAVIPEIFEKEKDKTFDYKGMFFFTFSILVLFLSMLVVQQGILPAIYLIPAFLLFGCLFIFLIAVEKKNVNPLINLQMFEVHEFSFGLTAAFLAFIALNSTLMFLPFYLQDILKFSALKAGLIISIYPITMAIVAPVSGWLSDKITYRPLTVAGMCIATVALVLFSTVNTKTPVIVLLAYLALLGLGLATFQSPNNSSVMGSVKRDRLGIAGGINALFRNLGLVMGTTISVMIFSFAAHLDINSLTGAFSEAAFLRGLRLIFIFDAACCFLAVLINLTRAVRYSPGRSTKLKPEGE